MRIYYRNCNVNGIDIFYREAGEAEYPTIVLFHGFPSSSHMFRQLIPILAESYHVIAPDYPGFGNSQIPGRNEFVYSFEHISQVIEEFLMEKIVCPFTMYVFDYGAPIGFRIAKKHPTWITAIISQNGNIYEEGLGEKWKDRKIYWENPTKELRERYKSAFAPDTIKHQYMDGTPDMSVSPDGYRLDIADMNRPGMDEIQSDLILDYRTNVELYPDFQKYVRDYKPPVLCVWGKNDSSFIPKGALAFKKDAPDAQIYFVDSGHFALESHAEEIGSRIIDFLREIN